MSRTHWIATTLLATTIAFVGCRRDRNRDEAPPTYTSPTETRGTTTTDTTTDTTTTDTVPPPAAEPQPNPTAAENLGLTPGPADPTAPAAPMATGDAGVGDAAGGTMQPGPGATGEPGETPDVPDTNTGPGASAGTGTAAPGTMPR